MSRNNKNSKRITAAKEISKSRVSGSKGPSSTTPLHGKTKAWWQVFPDYKAFVSGKGKPPRKNKDRTEGPEVAPTSAS